MDLLLGVLSDLGFDVTKPNCRSFVTYQQEREVEAELHRRVIGLMNGLSEEVSFLDTLSLTNPTVYTTDCTSYAPLRDDIIGRDYQLINRVRRNIQGHVSHELPEDFIHEFVPLSEQSLYVNNGSDTEICKFSLYFTTLILFVILSYGCTFIDFIFTHFSNICPIPVT